METGKEFTRLLNNLLRENQQYDTELKNFLDYLKIVSRVLCKLS